MVNITVASRTAEIKQALEAIKGMQVYVGIPEENSSRQEEQEGINNAELAFLMTNGVRSKEMQKDMESDVNKHGYHKAYDMYIQSHGSPLWQIEPAPIIEPAIEADKDQISALLGEAIKAVLDGDLKTAEDYLNKAGLEGQAASQDWFTSPKNGWPENAESTIKQKGSDKRNINTGELRKAITYVVKGMK